MKTAILLLAAIIATGALFGALALAAVVAALVAWMAVGARELEHVTPRPIAGEPLRQTLLAIDRQTRARRETVERWQTGRRAS